MSDTITGVVEEVTTAGWGQGDNKVTFYNLTIGGKKYGTGKTDPGVKAGAVVTFEAAKGLKGYWEADLSTLVLVEGEQAKEIAKEAVKVTNSKTSYWDLKDIKDDAKQPGIILCAARKVAVEAVTAMYNLDMLTIPKTKSDRYDAFMSLVETTAMDIASADIKLYKKNLAEALGEEKEDEWGDVQQ